MERILEPTVEMIFLAQKKKGVVLSVYTMIINDQWKEESRKKEKRRRRGVSA